jgi:hypothetical protein
LNLMRVECVATPNTGSKINEYFGQHCVIDHGGEGAVVFWTTVHHVITCTHIDGPISL